MVRMKTNIGSEAPAPDRGGELDRQALAGLIHDIKNNLVVLMLVLGILQRAPDKASVRKALATVRLMLVELAGAVTGMSPARPAPAASPDEVIEQVLDGFAATLPANICLTRWIEPDLPPLRLPPLGLSRVVLNLGLNARDVLPNGGEITVAAWLDADGTHVLLTVEDTGTGIPAEVRERLFTPGITTKPPGKGTGLGLASVKRLVHESGGEIAVESAPSKGTRFSLRLPVRQ
jgi:signal transduction histidine kinase